jgi:hypothetical protein
MKFRVIIFLLLIGYGPIAQEKSLPPIIRKLLSFPGNIQTYPLNNDKLIPNLDLPKNYNNTNQVVIKTKDQLLVGIVGTGRLYRLDTSSNDFRWTRMDSTYFTGYNFGCIYFTLDSTIYSFGGNGFWHINGSLRYFNPLSKEWNARPLSEEVHFSVGSFGNTRYYYVDSETQTLFINGMSSSAEYLKDLSKDNFYGNKLMALNIKTGDWKTIGIYKDSSYSILGASPWGLFVNNNTFIDVKNNKINRLSESKKDNMLAILENSTLPNDYSLSFIADSTLYIGDYYGHIDSMKINSADIIQTNVPFYTPIEIDKQLSIERILKIIIGILLASVAFLIFQLTRKRNQSMPIAIIGSGQSTEDSTEQNTVVPKTGNPLEFRSSKIIELLDEREKSLLAFIYSHSSDERLTSIDEINKIIGAAQRSTEIQKRLRSDIITSINDKLSLISDTKKPVISKQRSEFDKRSFEYFIYPEYMDLVKKVVDLN